MERRAPYHGTRARYERHIRAHEVPCGPCTRANAEYSARRRRALHHSSSTDLYPLIGLLAQLLGVPERAA